MFIVQTVSQIQEAVREKVGELLVLGHLATDIKEVLESRDIAFYRSDRIHFLGDDFAETYDIVEYLSEGRYEHLLLCRKANRSRCLSPTETVTIFAGLDTA